MSDDDLNLNDFAQTEEEEPSPGPGNGSEPESEPRESSTDESIVASDTLISAAQRMGGFGLKGETRRAFEDEFGGLARLISKIFAIDDASKIMSLRNTMNDETRLIGGVLLIAGGAGLWRLVINKDLEMGGQISPTKESKNNGSPGSTSKDSGGSKSKKEDKTTPGKGEDEDQNNKVKSPGNMNFTSFHDLEE